MELLRWTYMLQCKNWELPLLQSCSHIHQSILCHINVL